MCHQFPSSDVLHKDVSILRNASLSRFDYIFLFEQRFERDQLEEDILHNEDYWTQAFPHENSGPCETYNPPVISESGHGTGIFLKLKYMPRNLELFLHEKNKFFYTKNQALNKFTKYVNWNDLHIQKRPYGIKIAGKPR